MIRSPVLRPVKLLTPKDAIPKWLPHRPVRRAAVVDLVDRIEAGDGVGGHRSRIKTGVPTLTCQTPCDTPVPSTRVIARVHDGC